MTRGGFWTVLLALGLTSSFTQAASEGETRFPGKDWEEVSPAAAGWNSERLKAWEGFTFSRGAHVTDGVLVIHQGRLLFERYDRGYDRAMRHLLWSVTKSFWTTLFGIAEGERLVSREDPITKYFPEASGSAWDEVRLKHLTTMTTGIESHEGYETSPFKSDIVAALYRFPWLKNKGEYRLQARKRVAGVGERFAYTSGDTNLLSAAMRKALGAELYERYPEEKLFRPIGATSFHLEKDHSGVYTASSYLYASARDVARFGYLLLRNGRWAGKQIVPEAWVREAQTPSSAFETLRLDHRPMEAYSTGWWLNRPVPTAQLGIVLPSAPSDLFWAEGHEGQYIFIVPSLDLVVVRVGLDRKKDALDRDRFFRLLIQAMPESFRKKEVLK